MLRLADGADSAQIISRETQLSMKIQDHAENITLNLGHFPKHPLILGMPWLRRYNLSVDWRFHSLTFLSQFCRETCQIHKTIRVRAEPENEDIQRIAVTQKQSSGEARQMSRTVKKSPYPMKR